MSIKCGIFSSIRPHTHTASQFPLTHFHPYITSYSQPNRRCATTLHSASLTPFTATSPFNALPISLCVRILFTHLKRDTIDGVVFVWRRVSHSTRKRSPGPDEPHCPKRTAIICIIEIDASTSVSFYLRGPVRTSRAAWAEVACSNKPWRPPPATLNCTSVALRTTKPIVVHNYDVPQKREGCAADQRRQFMYFPAKYEQRANEWRPPFGRQLPITDVGIELWFGLLHECRQIFMGIRSGRNVCVWVYLPWAALDYLIGLITLGRWIYIYDDDILPVFVSPIILL